MTGLFLVVAIVLEVCGTVCLKLSDGFSRLAPSVAMSLLYLGSFYFLALTLKKMDVSMAYAIWSGVGTALISVAGVMYFHEHMGALKVASIALIIVGVVGLNLAGGAH